MKPVGAKSRRSSSASSISAGTGQVIPITECPLPHARAARMLQTQDFSYLPHRQSLAWHRFPPWWRTTLPVIGSSTSTPTPFSGLSGINRNQWPLSIGITVRLASESLAAFPRIPHPGGIHPLPHRRIGLVLGAVKHIGEVTICSPSTNRRKRLLGPWPASGSAKASPCTAAAKRFRRRKCAAYRADPSQSRRAFSTITWNTPVRSLGEELITCRTSAIAVSRASASSRSALLLSSSAARSAMLSRCLSEMLCPSQRFPRRRAAGSLLFTRNLDSGERALVVKHAC